MVHWRKNSRRRRKILQTRARDELFRQKGQELGPTKSVIEMRTIDDLLYDYGCGIHSKAPCVGGLSHKIWATTERMRFSRQIRAKCRASAIPRLPSSRFTNSQALEKVTKFKMLLAVHVYILQR